MNTENIVIFVITSLCLGAVLLMGRDKIPDKLRKGLALTAVVLVAMAFIFVIAGLLV